MGKRHNGQCIVRGPNLLPPVFGPDESERARAFVTGEQSKVRLLAACRGDFRNGEFVLASARGYQG